LSFYLDASAAAKLLVAEPESNALVEFVDRAIANAPVRSSLILETEMRRLAHREGLDQQAVSDQLAQVELILPQRDDFPAAGLLPAPGLRAIDALHLQTALRARAEAMIVYDHRLSAACHELGLRTVAPA
jgi:predicted nucleic acid-binding protein